MQGGEDGEDHPFGGAGGGRRGASISGFVGADDGGGSGTPYEGYLSRPKRQNRLCSRRRKVRRNRQRDLYDQPQRRDAFKVTKNDTDDGNPDYSPNGEKITYSGSTITDPTGTGYEIYTINVGGDSKIRVTNNDTSDTGQSWGSRP